MWDLKELNLGATFNSGRSLSAIVVVIVVVVIVVVVCFVTLLSKCGI